MNFTLFEIVQQLKSEMARMRANDEILMQEKEGISKNLSDRQNNIHFIPIRHNRNKLWSLTQRNDNPKSKG